MRLLRLTLLAALGAVGAGLLARHAAALAAGGVSFVDEAVALGVTTGGGLVASWYALSAGAVLLVDAARLSRRAPRLAAALAAAVHRYGAPAVRSAVVAGAGVGLGVLPAAAAPEDVVPHDLRPGVVVTQTLPGGSEAPSSAPPTDDGASEPDGEPVPDAATGEVAPPSPAPTSAAPPSPGPLPSGPPAGPTATPATPPPDGPGLPAAATTASQPAPGQEDHLVRAGDSLWAVAARHLGPGATMAEVAAEWPRWYAANRTVVGADPDLIHPGQLLRAPEPKDVP